MELLRRNGKGAPRWWSRRSGPRNVANNENICSMRRPPSTDPRDQAIRAASTGDKECAEGEPDKGEGAAELGPPDLEVAHRVFVFRGPARGRQRGGRAVLVAGHHGRAPDLAARAYPGRKRQGGRCGSDQRAVMPRSVGLGRADDYLAVWAMPVVCRDLRLAARRSESVRAALLETRLGSRQIRSCRVTMGGHPGPVNLLLTARRPALTTSLGTRPSPFARQSAE